MNKIAIAKMFQAHLAANGFKLTLQAIRQMDSYQSILEYRENLDAPQYVLEDALLEHTNPAAYHAQFAPLKSEAELLAFLKNWRKA